MTEKNELSISEALRKGRETRGETIEQVQQKLGVSLKILQGIEAGDYDVVEPIYARLAIWHYAEHVGLGGDVMAARFEQEIGLPEEPVAMRTDDPSPVPVASASPLITFLQRQPLTHLLGAALLLIALLIAAAALLSNSGSDEQSYAAPADYLSSPLVVDASASQQTSPTPAPSSSRTSDTASPAAGSAVTHLTAATDADDADGETAPESPGADEAAFAEDDAESLPSLTVVDEVEPVQDASSDQMDAPDAPASVQEQIGGSPSASSDPGSRDSGTPDSGTPDSGTPDSGTPDSGTPDPGSMADSGSSVSDAEADRSEADRSVRDASGAGGSVPDDAGPDDAGLGQPVVDAATVVSDPEAAAAVADPRTSPPPVVQTDGPIVLEARAIDSTWVQVQWDGIDGIEEIIPQGEVRRWTASQFFMVRAGRAHGVHFRLQGTLLGDGRLGDATRVLRFRGLIDGYQLLGPELESLGDFTPLPSPEPATESVDTERP